MGQQKEVPFGQLLDGFGKHTADTIENLKRDSLKPAIISDVVMSFVGLHALQQLFVVFYNLHVKNFDVQMQELKAIKTKNEELETRMAGYSSELNILRGKIAILEEKPNQI